MGGLCTLWVLRPKEFIRQETSSSSVPTLFHFIPLDSSFWHFPFFLSFRCFSAFPFCPSRMPLIRSVNEMGGVGRSVVTFSTQITRLLMAESHSIVHRSIALDLFYRKSFGTNWMRLSVRLPNHDETSRWRDDGADYPAPISAVCGSAGPRIFTDSKPKL
jgi:hypothetical protein